jgi:transposase
MHLSLKTLLNHVERLEGFVYESSELSQPLGGRFKVSAPTIEICLRPHQRKLGKCSQCQAPAPGYDRLPERRFQFVPLWGMAAYFIYAPGGWSVLGAAFTSSICRGHWASARSR